jgi:peptide deformylase
MAKKDIIIWPDPILANKSLPIVSFDEGLQGLVQDLLDTMISEPMAGLSAPQIGVNMRVFVADIDPKDNDGNGTDGTEVFINPEILKKEGSFSWEEGCMSIPNFRGEVSRAQKIFMRFQDINGQFHEREAISYLSGCFQHEIDHLDGILWVDYQSNTTKNFIKKRMLKLKQLPKEKQKWERKEG